MPDKARRAWVATLAWCTGITFESWKSGETLHSDTVSRYFP